MRHHPTLTAAVKIKCGDMIYIDNQGLARPLIAGKHPDAIAPRDLKKGEVIEIISIGVIEGIRMRKKRKNL